MTYDAILLTSFGGPEGPDEVMPYLERVTAGRGVPYERLVEVSHHYMALGGVSPINDQNRALLAELKKRFPERGIDLPIYWGNRNSEPFFADVVKNVPTEFFEMSTPDGKGAINYGYRAPVGVVGVICPWNLPLLLMTWKVGPALACGDTVVIKPSEETPQTAALLGEVMNEVGIPPGVYNVVHGFGPDSAGKFNSFFYSCQPAVVFILYLS